MIPGSIKAIKEAEPCVDVPFPHGCIRSKGHQGQHWCPECQNEIDNPPWLRT